MESIVKPPEKITLALSHTDSIAFNKLIHVSPQTIDKLIDAPALRKAIAKVFEWSTYRSSLSFKEYPRQVQLDKFYITRAFIKAIDAALASAQKSPVFRHSLVNSVLPAMFSAIDKTTEREEAFKRRYGFGPPRFLVLSPTKFCNLHCTGCYANSDSASREKLSFETVDRIIREKTEVWGSVFTVISGGEPLLYESEGKTILDLARAHQDNYFLMYTNGTTIDKEMAHKLAEVGNITPAISVEGYENETDARRGKGIYKKVLSAMENLRAEGVPFGVSLTATKENAHLIPSKELVEYYTRLGALYFWIFQLMPIGRASMDLVVTAEQRLDMYNRMFDLIKNDRYFIADFWNGGTLSNGCISAGRMRGGGYLYIDWAGHVTPCVFNPYAAGNVNEIYTRGGELSEVLVSPYFESLQEWQKNYAMNGEKYEGNWVLPCPMRDHYADMLKILEKTNPEPADEAAAEALHDPTYHAAMIQYDKELEQTIGPLWKKKYLKH
ncbi:MAG: radical SAM/SPASM domain-containing protein [Rectinema subterraneum]|uniref:radical SAM/SPASM domain-containing protein n=1 Tax=Rectinema subterraneum TaxID=2653714 RepID=UPI003C7CA035